MYNINDQFYDESNNRYITIIGKSIEYYLCSVEEMDENFHFTPVDDQLFTEIELSHFIQQESEGINE